MINQYEIAAKKVVNKDLPEFAMSKPLTGVQMEQLLEKFDLKLTESGNALGINTSALYGKKKRDEPVKTNISLLLRLYATFEDYLPRIDPPTAEQLIEKIQEADPSLPAYALGPILGLETTSGYRLLESGLDSAVQSTRILAWLIYRLLCDDLGNWETIKNILMVEATARGVREPEKVLRQGGWNKNRARSAPSGSETTQSTVSKKPRVGAEQPAAPASLVKKKPRIRNPQ